MPKLTNTQLIVLSSANQHISVVAAYISSGDVTSHSAPQVNCFKGRPMKPSALSMTRPCIIAHAR